MTYGTSKGVGPNAKVAMARHNIYISNYIINSIHAEQTLLRIDTYTDRSTWPQVIHL